VLTWRKRTLAYNRLALAQLACHLQTLRTLTFSYSRVLYRKWYYTPLQGAHLYVTGYELVGGYVTRRLPSL